MSDVLFAVRAALAEVDRYAYEARNRALRSGQDVAHQHWMGHASGLDHAARIIEGALAKYAKAEVKP